MSPGIIDTHMQALIRAADPAVFPEIDKFLEYKANDDFNSTGQVEIANEVFGLDAGDLEHARAVLAVWQKALQEGKGVAVLDGQLIENLHAAEAERAIAFAEALAARS